MVGEDGLSKVCVPLCAPGFALNIACHAHFRDGVFGAQHIRDVAKGGRKQGVTWRANWEQACSTCVSFWFFAEWCD